MRVKVEHNNSFQDAKISIAGLKMNKSGGGGGLSLVGTDPKDETRKFTIELDSDEIRILSIDFLDCLKEDEKTARSGVAQSYRRKLARG